MPNAVPVDGPPEDARHNQVGPPAIVVAIASRDHRDAVRGVLERGGYQVAHTEAVMDVASVVHAIAARVVVFRDDWGNGMALHGLRTLHSDPCLRDVERVLLLAANAPDDLRRQFREAWPEGRGGIISEPYSLLEVRREIDALLGRRPGARPP